MAVTPADFQAHAAKVIDVFAQFDPVWGTNVGIHAYDDHLADYSRANVERFAGLLKQEMNTLAQYDTAAWPIDDRIDYRLLISNIQLLLFQLQTFPYWKKSPSVYTDQCLGGVYYLALRDFASIDQKLPALLGRLNDIPTVCRTGKINLTDPVPIFVETAIEAIDQGIGMIGDICQVYIDKFPDRAAEIAAARDRATEALKSFNLHILNLAKKARGDFAIGKRNLEFLLSKAHFLDMGSDSLMSLGEQQYALLDSEIKALELGLPPKDTLPRFPLPSLDKQDVLAYCQWEINKEKDYVIQKKLATFPEDIGQCIPRETPAFLRGIIRGIAYEPPAPLDKIQTGFFYVRPLPDSFKMEQKAAYLEYICNRNFRGSVVHEAYPGHHLQLQLSDRNPSIVRKIQQDNVLVEGWALYCEQMVYEQGLYGENLRQWYGILGGARFRAVRIIVDIGLQTGKFTPQSALEYMNQKLGENTYYFKAEIRRYCAYPTQALSYLTGKTLILRMRDRAKAEEGENFSLLRFHDRLLSEGSISPVLIAQKYGW
jgi:uncharacterized protein (DUF885 family)